MLSDPSEIPPVDVSTLPLTDGKSSAEELSFSEGGKRLDRNLRRIAGYGALTVAAVLYIAGVVLALKFAKPLRLDVTGPSWHIVAAILAALFTVPTVLVLAVLRSSSLSTKDADADSLHAAIGTRLMGLLDKLVDSAVK